MRRGVHARPRHLDVEVPDDPHFRFAPPGASGGVLGSIFAFVFSAQQIFTDIYQLGHYFPLAFAAIAIGTAIAGFINSRLVGRLGMRVISHGALLGFVAVAATMLVAAKMQMLPLPLFMALSALMMFAF